MKPREGKMAVYWADCLKMSGKKLKRYLNKQNRRVAKQKIRAGEEK